MIPVKKLSIIIAGAAFSAFSLGQEVARAHPGHSHFMIDQTTSLSEAGGHDVLVVPPDAPDRPAYYSSGRLNILLATAEETGGAISVVDVLSLPEFGAPPHIHTGEDEIFYVLEGQFNFQIGSPTGIQNFVATPGTFVFAPKDKPHGWANIGTADAKLLAMGFPGGVEGFLVELDQPVTDRSAPIPTDPPTQEFFDITQSFGLQPAFPSDFFVSEDTIEGQPDYLVIPPGAVEDRPAFNNAGALFTSLATLEETGGKVSVYDVLLDPDIGSIPLVSNDRQSASFYVLDGNVTFQTEGKTTVGTPGTFVHIPKDISYAFQNLGTTPARTLLLNTPVSVPESTSTLGLLALGALGTACFRKRKKNTEKTAIK